MKLWTLSLAGLNNLTSAPPTVEKCCAFPRSSHREETASCDWNLNSCHRGCQARQVHRARRSIDSSLIRKIPHAASAELVAKTSRTNSHHRSTHKQRRERSRRIKQAGGMPTPSNATRTEHTMRTERVAKGDFPCLLRSALLRALLYIGFCLKR